MLRTGQIHQSQSAFHRRRLCGGVAPVRRSGDRRLYRGFGSHTKVMSLDVNAQNSMTARTCIVNSYKNNNI
jgi:hypothetical protein